MTKFFKMPYKILCNRIDNGQSMPAAFNMVTANFWDNGMVGW